MLVNSGLKEAIVGSDQFSRAYGLIKDVRAMVASGTRLPGEVADVLQIINDRKDGAATLLLAYRATQIPGSELVFGLAEGAQFLREFCGIAGADCAPWATKEQPAGTNWAICDAGWTTEELIALCEKVPHYDFVADMLRAIKQELDPRQPDKKGRILWTPAGLEATQACPEFVSVSYRRLWQISGKVLTARETVILWLEIYWKHQKMLDRIGWSRTCSRNADGSGVNVDSSSDRLGVLWRGADSDNPNGSARSAVLG
jgi:hypothetical protein